MKNINNYSLKWKNKCVGSNNYIDDDRDTCVCSWNWN